MNLTVIVPFFNEEKYLKESVSKLASAKIADEIFLVDDCSKDNSLKIAQELTSKFDNITLFKKNINEGKGSCLDFVKNKINTTHLIIHDADLEQNPFDIIEMFKIAKMSPEDLILGSRTIGKQNRRKMYKVLSFANFILCMLFNKINKSQITDISSGYLLYPSKFLKSINIEEKGFGLEVEIISKFLKTKNRIIELPIDYDGRTYSDGKKIKPIDGINILFKIIKFSIFSKLSSKH